MVALKHNLETLCEFLRQTGVGALPIIPSDPNNPSILQPPTSFSEESQLIQNLTQSVQTLYEKRKKMQDNSATVAILLSSTEPFRR